jgi:hypothetical protein
VNRFWIGFAVGFITLALLIAAVLLFAGMGSK